MSDDFTTVPDDLRERTGKAARLAIPGYDALAEGKTVFFPLTNGVSYQTLGNRIRNGMENRGKRATVRHFIHEDQEGVLAWVTGPAERVPA